MLDEAGVREGKEAADMSELYRTWSEPEPYEMSPKEEALRDYLMKHLDRLLGQRTKIYRAWGEPTHIAIPETSVDLAGATFLGLPLRIEDVAQPMVRAKRGYPPGMVSLS